jgi:hypothetical protein
MERSARAIQSLIDIHMAVVRWRAEVASSAGAGHA